MRVFLKILLLSLSFGAMANPVGHLHSKEDCEEGWVDWSIRHGKTAMLFGVTELLVAERYLPLMKWNLALLQRLKARVSPSAAASLDALAKVYDRTTWSAQIKEN